MSKGNYEARVSRLEQIRTELATLLHQVQPKRDELGGQSPLVRKLAGAYPRLPLTFSSKPNRNKETCTVQTAVECDCYFSHPSAAPSGDGSLRKLTNVEQGAGERLLSNTLPGLMRDRRCVSKRLPVLARSSGCSMPKRGTIMKADYVWEEVYAAAILETDDAKLPDRLHVAKAAIDTRLHDLQLDHGGSPEERQAISDALAGLNVLRRELERRSHGEGSSSA
jgi:hypothetical protein